MKSKIQQILIEKPQYKELLFYKSYFITEDTTDLSQEYPFYSQWKTEKIDKYTLYIHKKEDYYIHTENDISLLLIGHAYNPFDGEYKETELLSKLAIQYKKSEKHFFDSLSDLSGIFCIFVFSNKIIGVQDCSGIKPLYYGKIDSKICFTSSPQLVADIYDLKRSPFINKLVSNKFYNIGNRYLPGDLSPFPEIKRIGANVYIEYYNLEMTVNRFYPTEPHAEYTTEEDYQKKVEEVHNILHNSLDIISKKWNDCAISLSGGTDSKTTLACATGLYDKFKFFSFQSKDTEIIDSLAAHEICEKLGIEHEIFPIPENNSDIVDFDVLKAIICHSDSYIENHSDNEIRKILYFYNKKYCEVEVKSWVSETVRVFFERKYNLRFPKKLSPRHFSIFQTRYFLSPSLLHKSDKAYKEYMEKFKIDKPLFNFEHTDLYYWEVRMSNWGMLVTHTLELCHKLTFPFNNRRLVELFLSLPREYRKTDKVHNDIIKIGNKTISDANIHIKNKYFRSNRILLEKIYYYYRTLFR